MKIEKLYLMFSGDGENIVEGIGTSKQKGALFPDEFYRVSFSEFGLAGWRYHHAGLALLRVLFF